jgi:hypothetical protein
VSPENKLVCVWIAFCAALVGPSLWAICGVVSADTHKAVQVKACPANASKIIMDAASSVNVGKCGLISTTGQACYSLDGGRTLWLVDGHGKRVCAP